MTDSGAPDQVSQPEGSGPFVLRLLTKVEYGNTLHDLFGAHPAIAAGCTKKFSARAISTRSRRSSRSSISESPMKSWIAAWRPPTRHQPAAMAALR